MIYEDNVKKYCCEDISRIENYEEAVGSPESWHCHHRLETHNSDGERRLVDITGRELKALGMYYDRPADELIFLTRKDHLGLHMKDKSKGEEHKRKISEAKKGRKRSPFSEEWRRKISETSKGRKHSEETKRKISEHNARYWKGKIHSEEYKKRMSESCKGKPSSRKGKHWKLVDGKRVWY